MVVEESVLEDVMEEVDVGVKVIPTLDLPPELPPCDEEFDSRSATAEDFPSPKVGVGTVASPEKAVDIESVAGSDDAVVALGDTVRCGISTGWHADARGFEVEYSCACHIGVGASPFRFSTSPQVASKSISTSILAELSIKISVFVPLELESHAPFVST